MTHWLRLLAPGGPVGIFVSGREARWAAIAAAFPKGFAGQPTSPLSTRWDRALSTAESTWLEHIGYLLGLSSPVRA